MTENTPQSQQSPMQTQQGQSQQNGQFNQTDYTQQSQQPAQGQQGQQGHSDQELQELLYSMTEKLEQQDQKLSQSEKNNQVLERLQQALNPQSQKEQKDSKKWIEKHLPSFMESRQQGRQMPITEDMAVEMQNLMDRIEQSEKQNQQYKQQLDRLNNPTTWQDQQIYASMDNQITEALQGIYGQHDDGVYQVVSQKISDRLKATQQAAPDLWEQIRNDGDAQRKIVMKAVSEIVPPKAMANMRKQHEDAQPITPELVSQAWQEASQIEDPEIRAKAKEVVRMHIFEMRNPAMNNRR